MEESDIIKGCIANDRKSQEMLYQKHFNVMCSIVRRYSQDDDEIISIINNGFLKVFKNIKSYEGRGSFQGWIRKIMVHSISDYFRKGKKIIQISELESYDSPEKDNATDKLFLEDLLEIVDHLPTVSRDVFKLYCIEGYNHKEIAALHNFTEGTSKWHLSIARQKLREFIYKYDKNARYAG